MMKKIKIIVCFILYFSSSSFAYTSITTQEAKKTIDSESDLIVIDVREPDEYCGEGGHIPDSLNYPWNSGELTKRYDELPIDGKILVICRTGRRSIEASEFLDSKGFKKIYNIAGGITSWEWEVLTCQNTMPIANAGEDQTVNEGETVILDGSKSTDAEDKVISYKWKQLSGSEAVISNDSSVNPTFIAPDVNIDGDILIFQLVVTDSKGAEASDEVKITLKWINSKPIANAGKDQTVTSGTLVTLDGSNSYDSDDGIDAYEWIQTEGKPVSISSSDLYLVTFTAPEASISGESLIFQLTVTDKNGLKSSDTIIINITWINKPPVADSGADISVNEGDSVILDASKSYDVDDGISSYKWEQTDGIQVQLQNIDSIKTDFIAPNIGDFESIEVKFKLTITDVSGLKSEDEISVKILKVVIPDDDDNDNGNDQYSEKKDKGSSGSCFINILF
ncbi:MAG: hypothetical protein HQK76_04670 [Desulfobacterales bacterium]|nr:hypothetical protein [Desulfobacterales bacterium]